MNTLQEEPNSLIKSYKFIRRPDIDRVLRLKLGILTYFFSYHGQVSELSRKYGVCRTFIYSLRNEVKTRLKGLFEGNIKKGLSRLSKQHKAVCLALEFRLVGKCSLASISELIHLSDKQVPHSVFFISRTLKDLGSKLGKMINWQGKVYYASDEIYMIGHQPVLVTVDPLSGAILRMELLERLSKEAWEHHWQALRDAGIQSLGIIKDEGVAMTAAHQAAHSDISV